MEQSNKLSPAKLWILILVTIIVVTLLVFMGIKLFSKSGYMSISTNPHIYSFVSDACAVSFNTKSEQFTMSDNCWDVKGSKFNWYMICNSPKVGDFGRAVEVRVFFRQEEYTHMYAHDLWKKEIKYSLKDFSKDIEEGRIRECMYQYPMKLFDK